jgi:micrococcal nuclease
MTIPHIDRDNHMHNLKTFIIILALYIAPLPLTAKNVSYGDAAVSEVTSIYDGDTFRANIEGFPPIVGEHIPIRINGIDTPELRGKCDKDKQQARLAKQFTVERLRAAKSISLHNIKRGKYFRLIADVYIDGSNLGELLIKHGHAVNYDGGRKTDWC